MKQLTTPITLFKSNYRKEFSQATNYHKDASAVNVGFVDEQQLKHLNLHKKLSYLSIKTNKNGFLLLLLKSCYKCLY